MPGIRFVHAGTGKNAADLLLSIDAVELALREGYEMFVIASSDGDFSHLAIRLRETGHLVVGCGVATAPARFRTACSRFVELGSAEVHLPVPPAASELQFAKLVR
ncbi:MAG: NYN domain-containing protein [Paracoccaceae bacterium]